MIQRYLQLNWDMLLHLRLETYRALRLFDSQREWNSVSIEINYFLQHYYSPVTYLRVYVLNNYGKASFRSQSLEAVEYKKLDLKLKIGITFEMSLIIFKRCSQQGTDLNFEFGRVFSEIIFDYLNTTIYLLR